MSRNRKQSYAGTWAMSYIIPLGAAWLVWEATGSVTAGTVTVIAAFVLFAFAPARRG